MIGQLIATNVLMIAVGVMVYLIVRTLPRISDEETAPAKGVLERWLASEFPERLDAAMNGFLLKFLRRAKVVVMKIDNFLNKELNRVKLEDQAATAQKPDLSELRQRTTSEELPEEGN